VAEEEEGESSGHVFESGEKEEAEQDHWARKERRKKGE
jgi:hypothetical protein